MPIHATGESRFFAVLAGLIVLLAIVEQPASAWRALERSAPFVFVFLSWHHDTSKRVWGNRHAAR